MIVRPFRALRPEVLAVRDVASVPYDVVTTDEARALSVGSPLSFLHVTRAEIDLERTVDPRDPAVYEAARANLARLRRDAPLVVEPQPALYVYRLRDQDHEQTGLAGCYSLDEYDRGTIKKHERTRPDKEDDRTRHMVAVEAQTGIVFLTYRQLPEIDRLIASVCQTDPLFDFEAVDGVRHTVWRTSTEETVSLVDQFATMPALYIADGHHRAASAARARRMLDGTGRGDERDYFLAVAFPDHQTRILPYNRIVSDLAGAAPEQFLASVAARVPMVETPEIETKRGVVAMYVAGRWYRLELALGGPDASMDPVAALDVSCLQERLLEPVLGVVDIRTDKRVRFVGGVRGSSELERIVDSGQSAVAFSLPAVTVPELLAIADSGEIMPPKSTWFEPKLRDGLLTHLI